MWCRPAVAVSSIKTAIIRSKRLPIGHGLYISCYSVLANTSPCFSISARSTRFTSIGSVCSVSGASAPSQSALDASGCFGDPGPGQQFAEASVGPVVDELGEHVGEVGLRVDAV